MTSRIQVVRIELSASVVEALGADDVTMYESLERVRGRGRGSTAFIGDPSYIGLLIGDVLSRSRGKLDGWDQPARWTSACRRFVPRMYAQLQEQGWTYMGRSRIEWTEDVAKSSDVRASSTRPPVAPVPGNWEQHAPAYFEERAAQAERDERWWDAAMRCRAKAQGK